MLISALPVVLPSIPELGSPDVYNKTFLSYKAEWSMLWYSWAPYWSTDTQDYLRVNEEISLCHKHHVFIFMIRILRSPVLRIVSE